MNLNLNLNIFNTTNLFKATTNLFEQLEIKLNSNTAEALPAKDLLNSFYKDNEVFNSIKSTYFIGIIDDSVFQTTGMVHVNYSIKEALNPDFHQDDKNYEGLMIFALELIKNPTRTEISEITRAFNRISQKMPVLLVFKYAFENEAVISIAISERFKYLQNWRQGEKVGKVIILRDIFTSNTHSGHQRILRDLVKPAGVTNYAQLHAQWLEVLDVNILNKKFFQELTNWYFWAMDKVQFPDDIEKKKDVRNATNLIRLITRVIFIWFIKEKHLVPDSLFNEKYLDKILKDFHKNEKSSNYYQAILQNLFFGTLNQKMDERDFAEDHNRTNKLDQGIKNKYRYPDKFNISKKEIIDLFKDIPFLNGGLFDCLDKFDEEKLEKGKKEQIFVDGFTRLEGKQAIVPDKLFFGEEVEVDLTAYYDPEAKKPIVKTVKGLIDILNNYKFTVAENTPIEEEIALDPELLGKVFENLLANYNPETQTTARKQTGSFYTPREIVNYMVDESLIEYLKQSLKSSSPDLGEVARSAGGVKKLNNLPHLKTFRKTLRNNLTPAEAKLWTLLKGKQLEDKKFRRQFSVANYILDFYCPAENLAIELDGQGHFEETQAQYDLERDLFLQHTGIKVLRFENKWVWENPEGLIEEIKNNFNWKNKQPLSQPLADSSPLQGEQLLDTKLRKLFSYTDEGNPFNENETNQLIEAINNAKILDPACGSGAFPMGVLHKMVHLLQKLDPGNVKWKAQQKEKIIGKQIKELEKDKKAIEGLSDKAVREKAIQAVDERLKEIDEIFESKNNFDDYARKLYLIENCIYGIDIQPIAVQISKLRFFISLIIDQKVHKVHPSSLMDEKQKENRGIRPLPNLETKFVAANTLISLEIPTTDLFSENNPIKLLQEQLKATRHEYFNAKTRKDKLNLQKQDKELRKKIAAQISDALINKKEEKIKNLEMQLAEAKKKLAEIEAEPEQKETITNTTIFGQTETTVIDKKKEKIKAQKSTISWIEKQINALKAADNKDAIQKVAQQISSFDPYDQNHFANWFEPEWMYGNEVKDGFDIVIGNPPYVNVEKIDETIKSKISKFRTAYQKYDLYVLFYEKGIDFLKQKGQLNYITSNKFLSQGYGLLLRQEFLKYHINQIINFNYDIFEAATVRTCIFHLQKTNFSNKNIKIIDIATQKDSDKFTKLLFNYLNQNIFNDTEENNFRINLTNKKIEILSKISRNSIKVEDICSVNYGLRPVPTDKNLGKNIFIKNYYQKGFKTYFEGKDMGYWLVKDFYYIDYKPDIMYNPMFPELFENPKLTGLCTLSDIGKLRFVYNDTGAYTNHSVAILTFWHFLEKVQNQTIQRNISLAKINKSKGFNYFYIQGILNSKLIKFYVNELLYDGTHFYPNHMKSLPIKDVSLDEQSPLIIAVDKIHNILKTDMNANVLDLEKQIDSLVYKLYDLTEEEIAIIENSLKKD